MDNVRVVQKPRSRGRFSHQRDIWSLIHGHRFDCWLEGDPIQAIAEKHHVSQRSVHLSIAKVLAGIHRKYRHQAIQLRRENRSAWKAQVAALEAYQALTNPATWNGRLSAWGQDQTAHT